ncbi:MAG: VanZ family protein [Proteobacteria bacterium]|nr:VanZ family protein [Pseudomonadota bacterium]
MRVARALFAAALLGILILALMPLDAPPVVVNHIDKLEHAAVFALLWLLGRRASLPRPWLALGLLAFGAGIELAQATLTTYRAAEWLDWGADAVGITVGAALEFIWLRRCAWRAGTSG